MIILLLRVKNTIIFEPMKTKRAIYFILITLGVLILGLGESYMEKEYALAIGFVLLMFGVFNSSQSYVSDKDDSNVIDNEDE